MFTLSVITLAILGAAVILFRICEAITVESYSISACDFFDEASGPASGLQTAAPACASSQLTAAATSPSASASPAKSTHQRFGGNL
jgi:hypothetical protein